MKSKSCFSNPEVVDHEYPILGDQVLFNSIFSVLEQNPSFKDKIDSLVSDLKLLDEFVSHHQEYLPKKYFLDLKFNLSQLLTKQKEYSTKTKSQAENLQLDFVQAVLEIFKNLQIKRLNLIGKFFTEYENKLENPQHYKNLIESLERIINNVDKPKLRNKFIHELEELKKRNCNKKTIKYLHNLFKKVRAIYPDKISTDTYNSDWQKIKK